MPELYLLTSLEAVALLRDVVLIVFFAVGFLALFVFSVLGVLLYRRVSRVLDRSERVLDHLDLASGVLAQGASAAAQLAGGFGLTSLLGRLLGRRRSK